MSHPRRRHDTLPITVLLSIDTKADDTLVETSVDPAYSACTNPDAQGKADCGCVEGSTGSYECVAGKCGCYICPDGKLKRDGKCYDAQTVVPGWSAAALAAAPARSPPPRASPPAPRHVVPPAHRSLAARLHRLPSERYCSMVAPLMLH